MHGTRTKSIDRIEDRMSSVSEGSIRYKILESAKGFKTSWVELGQALYSVWRDKAYKEWGYLTFEAYTSKEIGIKKQTAMKLLKSYFFLEKEEPLYLQKDYNTSSDPSKLPTYETVNLLRLAKNKSTLDKNDYANIKESVLEMGKDAREVKKDLTTLMRQREELEPEEARRKRRAAVIKRLLTALKTLRTDIETSKMLPAGTIKEVSNLINRIELELK
ncbi:MAG: hypothetical protein WC738_03225 [Candidatus Omnitrophota bacterium]|jgi:hypothetical protein